MLIYPKINYYEPISFKIHSTNPEITKNISFNAITPLGRNIPLTYDSTIKTFSLDYSFVKHLNLSINQKTFVEITLTG